MFSLIGFVCIGINFFQLISGLNLTSPNVFMPTTGFTFICKVQGTINTEISVTDPLGNIAAACFQPPNGCGSSVGNTFNRNIADGTFTVDIIQSNVHTTNSKGNWTCTDGINVARFDVKEIVSFTNPMIWMTEAATADTGKMVMVLFECIYPYPEIKISYVTKSTLALVLDTENGGIFSNGTSVNCPVADARAISVNGTFPLSTHQFTEDALVAVTILLNGIKLPTIYSNITIASTNGCNYSDTELFLGGFSCFLIVLITTIIMLIILGCKILPEIFGDLSTKKKTIIIIIVVFIVVALIIGLALGFGLKECNQRNLGLGLGLGLGFLLAIVLVVTLFVYHKQRDSKKGTSRRAMEYISCTQSGQ